MPAWIFSAPGELSLSGFVAGEHQRGNTAMRYDDFRRSDDIEDRRGDDGGGMGGGGFGLPMGGGGLGIGTIIVLGLVGYAFGIDPRILIGGAEILTGGSQAPSYQTDRRSGAAQTRAPKGGKGRKISRILRGNDDRLS